MSTRNWLALSLTILLMLGTVDVSSFGYVTVLLQQLSPYDSANHYGTAIRKGTDYVKILEITITSTETNPVTWTELKLTYTGTSLSDVGRHVDLFASGNVLINERDISGGVVTFHLSETIPAGGSKNYTVTLDDIVSGAGSNKVSLGFVSASFAGLPDVTTATLINPSALSFIDASAPGLDKYVSADTPLVITGPVGGPYTVTTDYYGVYDRGTKILKLRFYDELDPTAAGPRVTNPLVRLVWAEGSDKPTQSCIDLAKILLRAPDNNQATNLSGATLLWPGTGVLYVPSGTTPPGAGAEFPAGASAFSSEVWIRLTSSQDVHVNNNIIPDNSTTAVTQNNVELAKVIELYINGALWDAGASVTTRPSDGDFKNLVGEYERSIIALGDITPPALKAIGDKPVKFDSKTRVIELRFTESVDSVPRTDVRLDKIHIFNYRFDEETGDVVIDTVFKTNLAGATVTEGYGTTLAISLTPSQRDVLKGDHPQLYIDTGAVKDVVGNPIIALNADGVDNDGDNGINDEKGSALKIGKDITAIVEGDGDANIDATNVFVTPVLLSGVETVYDGNPELKLKFSEELATVNTAKITITNDKDKEPFQLSQSEFDTIDTANGIARVTRFKLTAAHRDKVSYWQADADITELRVKLDAGAVVDIYGASNEAMVQGERIGWTKFASPVIFSISPNYGHAMGGTEITITGKYFKNGATVAIGGKPAVNVTNPIKTPAFIESLPINITDKASEDVQLSIALAVTKVISFPTSQLSVAILKMLVQMAIDNVFGKGNIDVTVSGSDTAAVITFTTVAKGSNVRLTVEQLAGSDVLFHEPITSSGRLEIHAITPAGNVGTFQDVVVANPDGNEAVLQKAFVYVEALSDGKRTVTLTLNKGVNIISLPLNPDIPYTASTLADVINATIVIQVKDGFFDAYVRAGSIGTDFPIQVGQGYIVNLMEAQTFEIIGKPWGELVPAAPSINTPEEPWAFVIAGRIEGEIPVGGKVRATNLRTKQSIVAPISPLPKGVRGLSAPSGEFTLAFVDMSRQSVVTAGDETIIQIIGASDTPLTEAKRHIISRQEIAQAYMLTYLSAIPEQSRLLQNYPNPFNPETWIPFQLALPADVNIHIYNAQGQFIHMLSLGQQNAGFYLNRSKAACWNGRNSSGERVASGIYFYQLQAGDFTAIRRMVIVK